jgi:hypothetical protein
MYNLSVELPSVEWSTVPGARSRGFNLEQRRLEEESAFETRVGQFFLALIDQLRALEMWGCYAVSRHNGKESARIKIA